MARPFSVQMHLYDGRSGRETHSALLGVEPSAPLFPVWEFPAADEELLAAATPLLDAAWAAKPRHCIRCDGPATDRAVSGTLSPKAAGTPHVFSLRAWGHDSGECREAALRFRRADIDVARSRRPPQTRVVPVTFRILVHSPEPGRGTALYESMMLVPEEVTNLPAQELHAPMRCGTAGPYPCVRCGRPCTTESSFSAYDKLDGCPVYVTLMWPRCRENGGRRGARACVVKRTACCGGGPRDRSRRPGGERRFRGSDGGCGRRHNSHGRRRGWHWGRHWRKGNGASEWRARQCGVGSGRCGRVRSRRSHPRHRELPNRAGGRKAERGGRPLVYSSSPFPSPGEE